MKRIKTKRSSPKMPHFYGANEPRCSGYICTVIPLSAWLGEAARHPSLPSCQPGSGPLFVCFVWDPTLVPHNYVHANYWPLPASKGQVGRRFFPARRLCNGEPTFWYEIWSKTSDQTVLAGKEGKLSFYAQSVMTVISVRNIWWHFIRTQ